MVVGHFQHLLRSCGSVTIPSNAYPLRFLKTSEHLHTVCLAIVSVSGLKVNPRHFGRATCKLLGGMATICHDYAVTKMPASEAGRSHEKRAA